MNLLKRCHTVKIDLMILHHNVPNTHIQGFNFPEFLGNATSQQTKVNLHTKYITLSPEKSFYLF